MLEWTFLFVSQCTTIRVPCIELHELHRDVSVKKKYIYIYICIYTVIYINIYSLPPLTVPMQAKQMSCLGACRTNSPIGTSQALWPCGELPLQPLLVDSTGWRLSASAQNPKTFCLAFREKYGIKKMEVLSTCANTSDFFQAKIEDFQHLGREEVFLMHVTSLKKDA